MGDGTGEGIVHFELHENEELASLPPCSRLAVMRRQSLVRSTRPASQELELIFSFFITTKTPSYRSSHCPVLESDIDLQAGSDIVDWALERRRIKTRQEVVSSTSSCPAASCFSSSSACSCSSSLPSCQLTGACRASSLASCLLLAICFMAWTRTETLKMTSQPSISTFNLVSPSQTHVLTHAHQADATKPRNAACPRTPLRCEP